MASFCTFSTWTRCASFSSDDADVVLMLNTVSLAWQVRTSGELLEGNDDNYIAWHHLRRWAVWRPAPQGRLSGLNSTSLSRSPSCVVIVHGPERESQLVRHKKDEVFRGLVSASSLFQLPSLNGGTISEWQSLIPSDSTGESHL